MTRRARGIPHTAERAAFPLSFSGVQWDAPARTLSFDPVGDAPFRSLFTTGQAWGRVEVRGDDIVLHVDGGSLELDRLVLRGRTASGPLILAAGESVARTAAPNPDPSPQEMP